MLKTQNHQHVLHPITILRNHPPFLPIPPIILELALLFQPIFFYIDSKNTYQQECLYVNHHWR